MKVYVICCTCHKAKVVGEKTWKKYPNLGNLPDANDVGYIISCPGCRKKVTLPGARALPSRP